MPEGICYSHIKYILRLYIREPFHEVSCDASKRPCAYIRHGQHMFACLAYTFEYTTMIICM